MTTLAPPGNAQPLSLGDSLSARLKHSTATLHTRAERSPRMRELAKGQLRIEAYREHLGQLYLLHDALERRLEAMCDTEIRLRSVLQPEQFQAQNALADLAYFGVSLGTFHACASLKEFISELEISAHRTPWKLFGMHYVLEGSKNGGRYLARAVRGPYNIEPGVGDRYLDPYGDAQPETWATFKAAMDALELTDSEAADVLDGARMLFELMVELGTPAG